MRKTHLPSQTAYLSAWLQLRYGPALSKGVLTPRVAVQFIVEH
ncbi:hypothetical protein T1E_4284 [Pseudomonas putida DOT-T1E]|uniref:Uncharacterized protein n=1 Tax=Pseudomonas putida (strain DOT-T1E) TaxID=1196325 RepID=I7BEK6_PSEPT|nr:hypothetical protein T1E_4284 [Pseudomonas putida DOT-T1E]